MSQGLSRYSGSSRAALIYAEHRDDPICVYDPQNLLDGHEPILRELYLESNSWRVDAPSTKGLRMFGQIHPEKNLGLAGLISYGGRTNAIFYQMWFTEHHPEMCSIGPTERWLEHAVCLLSHDFTTEDSFYTGSSRYVLQEYSTHAVRDFITDELNMILGWDTQMRVYPILDVVLEISKTLEEGSRPRGELVFISPTDLSNLEFLIRFPKLERPRIKDNKHVRKLLLAVEGSEHKLVSDGQCILGIATGKMPHARITADFRGGIGFIRVAGNLICSYSDGSFLSSTFNPKLYQLEELLLESPLDPQNRTFLYKLVSRLVYRAGEQKHGCTLVVDLNKPPMHISGQKLETPVDLQRKYYLELAERLAKIDGALHLGADLHLHGFACILDGRAISGEYRSRGARFNSALRFSAEHENIIVVVVSSDRRVSVIKGGVEMSAQYDWKPLTSSVPQRLEDWIDSKK